MALKFRIMFDGKAHQMDNIGSTFDALTRGLPELQRLQLVPHRPPAPRLRDRATSAARTGAIVLAASLLWVIILVAAAFAARLGWELAAGNPHAPNNLPTPAASAPLETQR
jgi:hypothetical protein